MWDIAKRTLAGVFAGIILWLLKIGVSTMPDLAWDFLKTFWPVIGGGVVFLIYWAIQFLYKFKSDWTEFQDKTLLMWRTEHEKIKSRLGEEFKVWLQLQDKVIQAWKSTNQIWIDERAKKYDEWKLKVDTKLLEIDEKFRNLKPRPETYTEPSGYHPWTREEIDELPDDKKAEIKRYKPDVWDWYLGKPI